MNNLTLLIPAKEESESLPLVLEELKKYNCKKLVVMDENDEITVNSIQKFDCEILFQKNLGYGSALIEGINKIETEYLCIFNADGSFNPNEIEGMVNLLDKNNGDLVFASRYEKDSSSDDDTIVTFIGNYIFTFLGKILFKLPITDILYTFVLGKTNKVKKLGIKSKDFTFCVELPIKAHKNNLKIFSISSHERSRIAGKKKVNAFKDGFLILKKMLTMFVKNKY